MDSEILHCPTDRRRFRVSVHACANVLLHTESEQASCLLHRDRCCRTPECEAPWTNQKFDLGRSERQGEREQARERHRKSETGTGLKSEEEEGRGERRGEREKIRMTQTEMQGKKEEESG